MKSWIVRTIGGALRGASMYRQPSAIALASAFGLAIGLMPKDNLFFVSLSAAACFLRMNYLVAIVMAVVVSFGVPLKDGIPWTDSIVGSMGKWMLESSFLQTTWMKVAQWPIMPWFRWNNSVVLGSFGIGLASFFPIYVLCMLTSRRLARFKMQSHFDAIVEEMSDYQIQIQADQNKRQLLKATIESNSERRRTIKKRENQRHRIDETAESDLTKPNIVAPRPEPAMSMVTSELPSKTSSAVLHETVIEIIRYRPKAPTYSEHDDETGQNPRDLVNPDSSMNINATEMELSATTETMSASSKAPATIPMSIEDISEGDMQLLPMVQEAPSEKPREEALRYLLWHLSGTHRQSRQQESVS